MVIYISSIPQKEVEIGYTIPLNTNKIPLSGESKCNMCLISTRLALKGQVQGYGIENIYFTPLYLWRSCGILLICY